MFDAWTIAGVGGGSAALSYIAAGWRAKAGEPPALRLSIDKSNSLVGDVRFLGGGLSWLVSMYTKGNTKLFLQYTAAASFLSLVQTEVIRYRLAQIEGVNVAKEVPIFPKGTPLSYGALPSGQAAHANQGAWAYR